MSLDHFRPKSIEEFKELKNDPYNLHYACHPCNTFKADDWPALGTDLTVSDGAGYIDPFNENRNDYFAINHDGALDPLQDPAEYMIQYLYLNRPFLKLLRLKRELSYQVLNGLYIFFTTEAGAYAKMLENSGLTESQRIEVTSELQKINGFVKLIEVFYELHKLP